MRRSRRYLLFLLVSLPVLVLAAAFGYMAGMRFLEGETRTFWQSVEWASETLTTTGYGADSRWQHPAMVLFVMVVQFSGVFLVILLLPVILIPFLEERFETRLPQAAPKGIENHAVIFRYGPAVETLLAELRTAAVPSLVVEPDDDVGRRIFEHGQPILHLGLEDGALEAARLERARALIANGTDDENASLILSARQLGFQGPILALVEEPYHRRPMELAGATATFTPRHILGAALAARVSSRIDPGAAPFDGRQGHFVVGGGGEVGRKVVELLRIVGEEVRLIDRNPGPEVDLVGNVLDLRVLEDADVRHARAVILALDTDSVTLFATVILKDLVPEVPVIARVNRSENVERIHRAGASFALSISQVSGQMLAKRLLGGQ